MVAGKERKDTLVSTSSSVGWRGGTQEGISKRDHHREDKANKRKKPVELSLEPVCPEQA